MTSYKKLLAFFVSLITITSLYGQSNEKKNYKKLIGTWKLTSTKVLLIKKNPTMVEKSKYEELKMFGEMDDTDAVGYKFYVTFTKDHLFYENEQPQFVHVWKIIDGKIVIEDEGFQAKVTLVKNVLIFTDVVDELIQTIQFFKKE